MHKPFSLKGPKLKLDGGPGSKSKRILFCVAKMQNETWFPLTDWLPVSLWHLYSDNEIKEWFTCQNIKQHLTQISGNVVACFIILDVSCMLKNIISNQRIRIQACPSLPNKWDEFLLHKLLRYREVSLGAAKVWTTRKLNTNLNRFCLCTDLLCRHATQGKLEHS